jgi:GxxExxY protein
MNKNYQHNVNEKYLHSDITGKILQAFYLIINEIGYSFGLEIFKKALIKELDFLGLSCKADKHFSLLHRNEKIGEFTVDILVEKKVNVMLISKEKIERKDEIRLSNQLYHSDIEVGLILNAYIEGEHKRNYFSENSKQAKRKY